MSLLTVEKVTHGFGARQILEDASFRLLKGEHIGLIGANGEGKSTFLNIITGKILPDAGKITWSRHVTVGYLDQHTVLKKGMTIREVLHTAYNHMHDLEAEMLKLYEDMALPENADKMDEMMEDAGEIQQILEYSGFYQLDAKIEEVAGGLGLRGGAFIGHPFYPVSPQDGGGVTAALAGLFSGEKVKAGIPVICFLFHQLRGAVSKGSVQAHLSLSSRFLVFALL